MPDSYAKETRVGSLAAQSIVIFLEMRKIGKDSKVSKKSKECTELELEIFRQWEKDNLEEGWVKEG